MTTFIPTVPPIYSHKAYGPGINVRVKQARTENIVPDSFSELFDHYYGYVVRLVADNGIVADNAEDVAMTILLHFFRRDALGFYDPNFTTNHSGVTRQARFSTFLSGFVLEYLKHHRVMQSKKMSREPISLDAIVHNDEGSDSDTWLDIHGPAHDPGEEAVEYLDTVASIRRRLADVRPRTEQDKFNALEFFEAVREQVYLTDTYSVQDLAKRFGVATSTIQAWMKRLRKELA